MTFYKKYKTTIRFLTFLIFFLGNSSSVIFAQTTLEGKITDEETGEKIIGAKVFVKKNGEYVQEKLTDLDGNFSIKVDPGTYDVGVSNIGYSSVIIYKVIAIGEEISKVDIKLDDDIHSCDGGLLITYRIPLLKNDNTNSGKYFISESIQKFPSRNINEIISSTQGVSFTQ